MDSATLQIVAVGSVFVAFLCYINWMERRARKQTDADC